MALHDGTRATVHRRDHRQRREASVSLGRHESDRPRAPRTLADVTTTTPQAKAYATRLKTQGYRFIGPTSAYAFMQNVGVVNDHIHGCFRASDYSPAR